MNSDLTIRPFEASDAEAVELLWKEALPSSEPRNDPITVMCRKRNVDDRLFLVGQHGEQIVATVMAGYDGVRGWIYRMAVAPDCRRQGLGRRMLEAAEQSLITKGCPKINLQVVSSNREVVAFYENCGFSVEERISLGRVIEAVSQPVDPVPRLPVSDEIYLGQITWEDKPAIVEHLNASHVFHDTATLPYPYLVFDADQFISKQMRGFFEDSRKRCWAIRSSDGTMLGGISLHGVQDKQIAELGYWLAQPYWGRGTVTAAGRALCAFAFEEYCLEKIFAKAFHTNPASARVLEKIGFTLEGTLRKHFFRDGKAYDVLHYGMLR